MKGLEYEFDQGLLCYFEVNSFFHIHQSQYRLDYHNSYFNLACQGFIVGDSCLNESKPPYEFVETKEEFSFNPIAAIVDKKKRISTFEICNLTSDTFNTAYIAPQEVHAKSAKADNVSIIAESSRKTRSEKESEILGSTKLSAIPKVWKAKKFDLAGVKKIQLKRKGAKEINTNEICSEGKGSISGSFHSSIKEDIEDHNLIAIRKILQVKKSKPSQNQSIRRGQSTNSQLEYYGNQRAITSKCEMTEIEAQDYEDNKIFSSTIENNKSYIASGNSRNQSVRETNINYGNYGKNSDSYYKIIKNEIKGMRG